MTTQFWHLPAHPTHDCTLPNVGVSQRHTTEGACACTLLHCTEATAPAAGLRHSPHPSDFVDDCPMLELEGSVLFAGDPTAHPIRFTSPAGSC